MGTLIGLAQGCGNRPTVTQKKRRIDLQIKPIETVYNGYRFRSRLEARWAVFFDALGVEYEYEKQGYDLGELGWYLPDFWVYMKSGVVMFDVKPVIPSPEELTKIWGSGAFALVGSPYLFLSRDLKFTSIDYCIYGYDSCDGYSWVTAEMFSICRYCEEALMLTGHWSDEWTDKQRRYIPKADNGYQSGDCGCAPSSYDRKSLPFHSKLIYAFGVARSARFEYGETPTPDGVRASY